MPPREAPLFPFGEIAFVQLGAKIHGPSPVRWEWNTAITYFNFWFLIQGEGRLRYRGKEWALQPGVCFLFPPGARIAAWSTTKEPVVNFAAHFVARPSLKAAALDGAVSLLAGRTVHRMAFLQDLARHAAETYRHGARGDALGLRMAELAVLQMLGHLWREATAPPREQDDRILDALAEAGWKGGESSSVPELARRTGLSASQLTRRVRALTGMSPTAYLIRERIGHACALLAETGRPVGEIADALGYADPSYFVRQFQAVMKTTPARYRRKELAEMERRAPGAGSGRLG